MSDLKALLKANSSNILRATKEGGFFYFIFDGDNAGLIVFPIAKDGEGKRTRKEGRKMIPLYKKEFGKRPRYCEGEIQEGNVLTFLITKGAVKPSQMKKSLKSSAFLHEGVGGNAKVLRSAVVKLKMEPEEAPAVDDSILDAFAKQPEIALLGLNHTELAELYASEAACETYLPGIDNESKIQEIMNLEELRADLDLQEIEFAERMLHPNGSGLLEAQAERLKRLDALSQKASIGSNPFETGEIQIGQVFGDLLSVSNHSALFSIYSRTQLMYKQLLEIQSRNLDKLTPKDVAIGQQEIQAIAKVLQGLSVQKRNLG